MIHDLAKELYELSNELETVKAMTEEEIQKEYNTDESKAEFVSYLQDEVNAARDRYEEAVERAEAENSSNWRIAGLDPAFSSWAEVNRMFV